MDDNAVKARRILQENIYCTLATSSPEGVPWVSPVFFAYDEQSTVYWVSNKNARHSLLLAENPRVAIVMFNSTAPEGEGAGLYMEATAHILTSPADISHAMEILGKRVSKDEYRVKQPDEVMGESAWRIYRAQPQKLFILGPGEYIDGQLVDARIEVSMR